ncbi:hypothetical protein C6497_10200 [Candidatus Poribacteria bacterium]|nr:MAG: hypothetical protein C6497_10200 [Candidatus Poribacteria bacterium]
MYKELPGITTPNDDDILWRYMSFEKFVNMLDTKTLFFTRAYKYEDPFEGYLPRWVQEVYIDSFKDHPILSYSVDCAKKIDEIRHKYVMCNCWHQNEEESMAMWQQYRISNTGIAIKTTMERLKNSLKDNIEVFIGEIEYLQRSTYANRYVHKYQESKSDEKWLYLPYFHKRTCYKYENEVRLIMDADQIIEHVFNNTSVEDILNNIFIKENLPDIDNKGRTYNVDVNTLIAEIVISPYAEKWIKSTVQSVVHQYKSHIKVKQSTLLKGSYC